jgi:hypothetical protein
MPAIENLDNPREIQSSRIPPSAPVFERHYSVKDLAALWALSERTIRRIFADEPGIIEWGQAETRSKRAYRTLRIPESVAQRVHRRMRRAG